MAAGRQLGRGRLRIPRSRGARTLRPRPRHTPSLSTQSTSSSSGAFVLSSSSSGLSVSSSPGSGISVSSISSSDLSVRSSPYGDLSVSPTSCTDLSVSSTPSSDLSVSSSTSLTSPPPRVPLRAVRAPVPHLLAHPVADPGCCLRCAKKPGSLAATCVVPEGSTRCEYCSQRGALCHRVPKRFFRTVGRLMRLAVRAAASPAGSAIKDVLAGKTAGFIKRVGPYERAVSRLKTKKDGFLGDKIQSLEVQIQELMALTRWQAGLPIILPSEDEMSSGSEGEGENEDGGPDMARGRLDNGHAEALRQPLLEAKHQPLIKVKRLPSIKIQRQQLVKVERKRPIKIQRQPLVKVERKRPIKVERQPPVKVERKRPIKVERQPPVKVERKRPIKVEHQPSIKVERQQPSKVKRQPPLKNEE